MAGSSGALYRGSLFWKSSSPSHPLTIHRTMGIQACVKRLTSRHQPRDECRKERQEKLVALQRPHIENDRLPAPAAGIAFGDGLSGVDAQESERERARRAHTTPLQ